MKNVRFLLTGLLAAFVAVAALVFFLQRTPDSRPTAVVVPQPVVLPPPTPTVAACEWAPGATFAFSYRTQTRYTVLAQLPGTSETMPQMGQAELGALASFEVLSVDADTATLLGRLTDVNAEATKQVGDTVAQPFLARVNRQCEVKDFARLVSTPMVAARVQEVALQDLSFSVGDGTPVSESQFVTGLGMLRALSLRGGQGPDHFVRKPVRYVSRWSPRMEGVEVTDGQLDVFRGSTSWFERLHGVEVVAGGQVESSKTEWDVAKLTYEPAALATASRKLDDYVWGSVMALDEAPDRSALGSPSEDHEKRVAAAQGVSWDQAVSRFAVLVNSKANINEQWRDMAGFLDAHPESIADFAELITDSEFPGSGKAPAFLALGQAQAPQAREALLGLYRDRELGVGDRIRSSLALAGRVDVGVPLAKELRTEAARAPTNPGEAAVSRQALLHLGVLAGTRPTQLDVMQQATEVAQALLSTAKSEDDYSVLCGMVGNMGEVSLLPEVATWTRWPNPAHRKHVPHALRRYQVDRVHGLVVEWLARETDFDVKRELFNVLHHMYVDAHQPIDEALKREAIAHLRQAPLPLTRQSLYHLLSPHVGDPEVAALFKHQLKVEYDEKTGLYSLVASYLPQASVFEVLATLPGLAHQFGGTVKPAQTAAAPSPAVPPSPPTLPEVDQRAREAEEMR